MARTYQETSNRSGRYAKDHDKIARLENAIRDGIVRDLPSYRTWVLENRTRDGAPTGVPLDVHDYPFPEFLIDLNRWMGLETPAYHRGVRCPIEVAHNHPERPEHRPGIAAWLDATNDAHRRILQAYRGTGKTHIICAYACWLLMRDPTDTILIMRHVYKLSRFINKNIKNLLELFPPLQHLVAKVPSTWGKTEIEVSRWFTKPEPSVGCTSGNSGFVGFRGRLIVADDLETDKNVVTAEKREAIRETVHQMNLVGADILYIGTPHSSDSIYEELERTEHFEIQKYAVWLDKENGITQNPYVVMNKVQLQNADWVQEQRARLPKSVFESQLLMMATDVWETRMKWELAQRWVGDLQVERNPYNRKRQYWINEHEILELKAYWDPGYSRPDTDASVLRVVARSDTNKVFILECVTLPKVDLEKTFLNQCEVVVDTLARYHMERVIVETNFRITLKNELARVAADKKRNLQCVEHQRKAGYGGKVNFIRAMIEPILNAGNLFVRDRVRKDKALEREVKAFPKNKKDDHLDATAGAIRFLNLRHITPTGGKSDPDRLSNPLQRLRLNRYEPFARKSA